MEDIKVLNNKIRFASLSSIIFFIVVLVSTIFLYIFDAYLTKSITNIQTSITQIEANIKEVESDKNIQIYSILELNRDVINTYEKMNKITGFINNMNLLKNKYKLDFNGFELSDGEIKTEVSVISDDTGIAYLKARDFINKYREDTNSLYILGFVGIFEGMDEIKFNVNLKIK